MTGAYPADRLLAVTPEAALEKLRPICLELPEVIETVTYGNPTFMAGKHGWTSLQVESVGNSQWGTLSS